MSLIKKTSEVKTIAAPAEKVYDFLSDFEKISSLFEGASEHIPETEKEKINENIEDFQADKNSCKFKIKNFGTTGISIIDKEPHKTIKYQSDSNSPVPITMWIQLIEVNTTDTKMRLTLHTELNMMMKMMLKNKLDDGINKLAEALTMLPY